MTTITWTISTLDRQTSDGFVTTAHWSCTAQDGDYSGRVYSTCSWPEGQPVIPYADLTQDIVLGWCYANGVDKDSAEQAVQSNIDNQLNPPTQILPPPWNA